MPRILAIVIVLAGIVAGVGLGAVFGPADGGAGAMAAGGAGKADAVSASGVAAAGDAAGVAAGEVGAGISDRAYVKLGRQIIVPIVDERRTEALMLFELALDVPNEMTQRAYGAEPRLRDAFLKTLLEMSYTGAFASTYTDERVTRELRDKLRRDAERLLEGTVFDVLILDMLRQEL